VPEWAQDTAVVSQIQQGSGWVFDPNIGGWVRSPTGTPTTTYSPTGRYQAPATYQIPIGTQQAALFAQQQRQGFQTALDIGREVGFLPQRLVNPYWPADLIRQGIWQRVEMPDVPGGFWVQDVRTGRFIGAYDPRFPEQSDFGPDLSWRRPDIPFEAQQFALQNVPTLAGQQVDISRQLAETARFGHEVTREVGLGRIAADREIAAQRNQTELQIAQLQDATRRLEIEKQHAIAQGQLELAREIQRRQVELEGQRVQLEARRVALEEARVRAQMAAEPSNWIANVYFLRGYQPPAWTQAFGTPPPEQVLRTGEVSTQLAEVQPTQASDFNELPFLRALRQQIPLPNFQAPSGAVVPRPLGIEVPPAHQVNVRTFQGLLPSEREMFGAVVRASGQYVPDYLEVMRRAAPLGVQRTRPQRFAL
jgi:hypothetical protein